jgi:hypothetical protein
VQVEQLEAAEAGRAQRRFDVLLVAERLEFSRGAEKIARLAGHAMRRERFPEDLEIARLEVAGVFGDLVEVGIDAPLADLVANDRHLSRGDVGAVVGAGLGRFGVDARLQPLAPRLDARRRQHVKLVLRQLGPAGAAGVEPARIGGFAAGDPRAEIGIGGSATGLVGRSHQHERRVIPVGAQDALGLGFEPGVDRLARAEGRRLVGPRGRLDVKIETHLVGGGERGLRRTPRMEPQQVEPVCPRDPEDAPPFRDFGWRVPGLWKNSALQRAAEENLAAVQRELRALRREFAQPEVHGAGFAARECRRQPVQRGRELVPEGGGGAERERGGEGAVGGERRGGCATERGDGEFDGRRQRRAGCRAHRAAHGHAARRHVRINLQIVDPRWRGGGEFEAADDAVPVALGVIGNAVGVFADVEVDGVVDAEGELVPAGGHRGAEVVDVRRGQAVVRAEGAAVEPDVRLPVRALEREHDPAARPGRRDFHVALEPRRARVIRFWLQPERHLEVARLPVARVFRRGEERFVDDAADPLRRERDGLADALAREGARQRERVGQLAFEPARAEAGVLAVELKAPLAAERQAHGRGRCGAR